MIELLVMRHAKSDWTIGASDFNRPLNDRGVRAAVRMAAWLVETDLVPDRILASAAERTRATAVAVMRGCGIDPQAVDFDPDLYLADAATWRRSIAAQTCERLLICGHNPGVDDLVDALANVAPPLTTSGKLMTTAAIAHFSFDGPWSAIAANRGHFVSLTRPRELAE